MQQYILKRRTTQPNNVHSAMLECDNLPTATRYRASATVLKFGASEATSHLYLSVDFNDIFLKVTLSPEDIDI